jgi:aminoglycoside phosphotransferase (APT) family kinase protein
MNRATSLDTAAGPVRSEDAFDVEAMAAWLTRHAQAGSTDIDITVAPQVRQFSGGASNLTYLLRYPDGDLILRRPPKGIHRNSAHDVVREHRIHALWPYVRIPRSSARRST